MKSPVACFAQVYDGNNDAAYWLDGIVLGPVSEEARRIEELNAEVSTGDPDYKSTTVSIWTREHRFVAQIRQTPKPEHERARFVFVVDMRETPNLMSSQELGEVVVAIENGIRGLSVEVPKATLYELASVLPVGSSKKKLNQFLSTIGNAASAVLSLALLLTLVLAKDVCTDHGRRYLVPLIGSILLINLALVFERTYQIYKRRYHQSKEVPPK